MFKVPRTILPKKVPRTKVYSEKSATDKPGELSNRLIGRIIIRKPITFVDSPKAQTMISRSRIKYCTLVHRQAR